MGHQTYSRPYFSSHNSFEPSPSFSFTSSKNRPQCGFLPSTSVKLYSSDKPQVEERRTRLLGNIWVRSERRHRAPDVVGRFGTGEVESLFWHPRASSSRSRRRRPASPPNAKTPASAPRRSRPCRGGPSAIAVASRITPTLTKSYTRLPR